jgi:antitoxin MazE
MAKAQMVKWGNSLAIRIPKSIAQEARLREGDNLTLKVEAPGAVALRAANRPTLAELVARITPENIHQEQNWGDVAGNETW